MSWVVRTLGSRWFVAGVIFFGAALRIAQYLSGRSLWLDEALISLNIIHRPFPQLFGTLYYAQGAPSGFLVLERLAVDTFGSSEAALRLVPLLAGIAALPLFFIVARQLLGRAGAGAALVLFAAFEGPVIYSSDVKQYSGDVCLTLAVTAAGLALVDRPLRRRALIGLALLGVAAVWFSHAVVFVLAGVLLSLVLGAASAGDRRRVGQLLVVGATWAVSFAVVYVVNISRLPKGLGTYFLPISATSSGLGAIRRALEEFVQGELSPPAADSARPRRGRPDGGGHRDDRATKPDQAVHSRCPRDPDGACLRSRPLPVGRAIHALSAPARPTAGHGRRPVDRPPASEVRPVARCGPVRRGRCTVDGSGVVARGKAAPGRGDDARPTDVGVALPGRRHPVRQHDGAVRAPLLRP